MKLLVNRPSPYGRNVLVVVHEKGLADRVEIVSIDPWKDAPEFLAATPVGKVPALVYGDGRVLTESANICAYLDSLVPAPALVGADTWEVMARVGLARGIIDAAYTSVVERRRPVERRWDDWLKRQAAVIARTVAMSAQPPGGRFDLGDIALACGLAYVDFRLPDTPWRTARPDLAAWLDAVSRRPSMQATTPE